MSQEQIKTYRVNIRLLETLEEEIAALNKKAKKLRCAPAVLVYHGEVTEKGKNKLGFEFTKTFKIISVTGETPKLAGWKLVAAIEPQASGENLVSAVPGEIVPPEYRTTDTHCDHCKTNRRRSEVFVMKNDDGRVCQIGRNCIKDFLGGKSPEGILAWASWAFEIDSKMQDAETNEGFGGGYYKTGHNVEEFLKMTAAVIRKCGWVSRSTVAKLDAMGPTVSATVDTVIWLITHSPNRADQLAKQEFIETHGIAVEERDETLALAALAWGKTLPTDQGDYIYNLGVACRLGFVQKKTSGLMASLIAAYQREQDREAELNMRKSANKTRVHLGVVGERCGFAQVKITSIRSFESEFGVRTMIRFEDAEGSVLIWWKSGDTQWKEGDILDITGRVKKHDAWKEMPQTILQRVTLGLPKEKKTKKTACITPALT